MASLAGPGGVGKTRLAIRAATDLQRGLPDGAWLVELADVRDPTLAANAVLAALDLRDQAATDPLALVWAYLRAKELLLVVDNCEHLLEAAAHLVAELIAAAPGVRVIATSREPLSLSAEQVIPVPPLELPAAGSTGPLNHLRQNEAVMLFADRAAAASGTFTLNASNQAAVVDVCRRLDGLPLAIELAAVRTRVLSPEQMRDRLTDRFTLLTRGSRAALPRHQTLKTTIDWSYDLLEGDERVLLRRLCLFSGGFTLEDVESVCTTEDMPGSHVLDLLSSLVDKSLVMKQDVARAACFRLHETMREYAALEMKRAAEAKIFEERFVEYYRAKCQRLRMNGRSRLAEWLDWIDLEIDNIRSVLRRCLDRAGDTRGAQLIRLLSGYWMTRATSEGVRWLDAVLARSSRAQPGSGHLEVDGWTHHLRGFLALLQADPAAAHAAFQQAHAAARATGQLPLLSHSLSLASIGEHMAGDHVAAAETVRSSAAARIIPTIAPLISQAEATAMAALGASKYDAEFAAGQRLSHDAAVRLALAEAPEVATAPVERSGDDHLLAKREAEIAHLVREGLTNKQIGARLFISEHTVDSHIRKIMNKLGVSTRARIAAWVASNEDGGSYSG